jgi:hypothetical protein
LSDSSYGTTKRQAGAPAETHADFFVLDLADEALERAAATTGGHGVTMIYCTQDLSCGAS